MRGEFVGVEGLQTSQDSKEGRGRGVQMPERGRQQTETRQSQATLPSPREGAASVEGRALRHRGEPMGALSPPYPTLTGDLLGGLGTWLEGQSSFQPSLTAGLRAAGAEAASRGGDMWGSGSSAEEAG